MKPRALIGMLLAGKELQLLMDAQAQTIGYLLEERQRENLESARYHRDIIGQFLIELDRPENHDRLRDTLEAALVDLSDQVARCEEQTV